METKETKEVQIVAPEGYEIDKDNSTLERIIFKKKVDRPRTWEEFCKRGFTGKEAHIDPEGVSETRYDKGDRRHIVDVGYVDNVKEGEAFVALMQLRQLRKAWVGNWEPDWLSDEHKYVIIAAMDGICIKETYYDNGCLSFPTNEMAIEFMKCFKGLLEKAKMLL